MIGLFCPVKAKNNDEYKIVIKKRMNFMVILAFIGILTGILSQIAKYILHIEISDYTAGFYCGVGIGLFIIAFIFWIRFFLLLKNEEKLKENRLKHTDERIQDIHNRAFRMAAFSLIGVLYIIGLVEGLFYSKLTIVILACIYFFFIIYFIFIKIYERKM